MNREGKNIRSSGPERPYIGIMFRCCNVYTRIYKNRRGDAYVGWCPKCGGRIDVRIAPYGSEERFFIAV